MRRGGNGRAVDRHEGAVRACLIVNGLGEQLFTRAALAHEKDVLGRSGESRGEGFRLVDLGAFPEYIFE